MLSFLRKQLSATNLMVVAALIFAMAGGAFAATGGGNHHAHSAGHHGHHGHAAKKGKKGKKGKNSGKRGPRGKQGPAGPKGETGPAGAAGAVGPAGPAGPTGPAGKDGTNGTNGKDGSNGASVEIVSEEPATCPNEEGVVYKVEGSSTENVVCKGEQGPPGPSCNELGECLLPSKATETGLWSVDSPTGGYEVRSSVSFPLRLTFTPGFNYVPYLVAVGVTGSGSGEYCAGKSGTELTECTEKAEALQTACPGKPAEPSAKAGQFCMYENGFSVSVIHRGFNYNMGAGEFLEANAPDQTSGTGFKFSVPTHTEEAYGSGSWAVTAP